MKTKSIIILALAIMAVLYAINLLTEQNNGSIENNFNVIDTASVERIFLVDKQNNQIDLQRKSGQWVLNENERPIQENVQIILKTLLKIEIKRPLSKAAYNEELKLLAGKSVKVEVYQRVNRVDFLGLKLFPHLKKTRVFYVGGATQNYQGTYMKPEDDDQIYITYIPGFKGYLTERFTARRADWLSHEIFSYAIMDMAKVRVEFPRKSQESYEIINKGDRSFQLIKLQDKSEIPIYDTIHILEELAAFTKINYEVLLDKMTDQKIDSIKSSYPVRIVTVTDKIGKEHKLSMYYRPNTDKREDLNGKLFDHDMDRMYAFIDNQKYPVSVQFFVVDNISRPLSYFLKKPIEATESEQSLSQN
jgi:hypothetical protein